MRKLLTILFLAGISLTTTAQIQINSDFNVAAQRSVDGKQYKVVNNKHVPYADTADFLATVPRTRRHIGEIAFVYGSAGKINVWQFVGGIDQPNLQLLTGSFSTNRPYPVQTIAEMLALDSAKIGDVAIVADSSQSYILQNVPVSNISNWLKILSPLLANTDFLPEGTTNQYYTDQRSRNAINAGAGISYDKPTGVINVTGIYTQTQIDSIKIVIQQQIRQEISDSVGNRAVDSITIVSGVVDTLKYWIEGVSYVGGFINRLAAVSDGVITPGYVTWLHDSTFFVSSATYVKNSNYYVSPSDTITVSGIDATYPVKFVFIVDTTGHAGYISGTPSPTPLDPQIDPASQLQLTTGITFNAGATSPSNLIVNVIYDEDLEWATGTVGTISVNFNNTVGPFYGVKNADIASYSKNAQLTFEGATQTVSDQILSLWIYLKVPLGTKNSLSFRYYNGVSASSNSLSVVNTFGLNPDLTNTWQQITIPYSAFTWSSQLFNKLTITMANSASNGFKLDRIELQSGLQNIPPQTDYSNKVDSVNLSQGNLYYWTKGIKHFVGAITDTSLINGWIRDSMLVIENSHYTTTEIDNIIDSVRQEIIDAGGGGVISFNGRTGPVVSQLSDYNTFFYPKNVIDSLLELKLDTTGTATDDSAYHSITQYVDSATLNRANGTKDVIVFPKTILGAHDPIWFDEIDTSFRLRTDSMPILKYRGRDTTVWDDSTLTDKKYLEDRIAAFVTGGVTQSQLDDSTAAIRAYSYPLAGNPSGFLTSSSISGKLNISDTASMLSPYIRTAVANATFATITNVGLKADKATTITINGTTQDLSTNRSWTVSGGTDTTSLSNRINQKVDSVKLSNDSLYAKVNGVWKFQFKSPAFANWKTNGSKIYTDAIGVGFGTSNPQSKIHIEGSTTSVGTVSEDSLGIMLTNSAAATSSFPNIVSMPIILVSKFYIAGGSRDYLYKIQAEGSNLKIFTKNGGQTDYTNVFTIASNGNFSTTGLINSTAPGTNGLSGALSLRGVLSTGSVGGNTVQFDKTEYLSSTSVGNGVVPGSIDSKFSSFSANNVINNTVGTTTVRGFYYNPTVQSLVGTTLIGFQNEVANNFFNTTGNGTSIGQTTTIPANRIFQVAATTQVSHPNPNMTIAQRDAISGVSAGDTIFCTDCTATDSSTGVTQTYNGSTWKNLW